MSGLQSNLSPPNSNKMTVVSSSLDVSSPPEDSVASGPGPALDSYSVSALVSPVHLCLFVLPLSVSRVLSRDEASVAVKCSNKSFIISQLRASLSTVTTHKLE